MFKTVLIAFCLIVVQSVAAQGKTETVIIKTPTDCNHCKVCETCAQKLETDLYYVRGIKLVTYNEADSTTTIVYKTKLIAPDKIRQEISKLGFDADNIQADPKAYAKRDDCCKK